MNRVFLFLAWALSAALCHSCQETEPAEIVRPQVTIHAVVPGNTKVALTPSGDGLHLSWESGDCLRVISGSQSEQFAIKEGFTDHEADFTGTAVSGSSFSIMYPGTFASVAEAEASDFSYQVQRGNGNTEHLRYAALLSGVDTYTSFTFSEEWAEAHGGTIKRAGAIKLSLTMPEGVTSVSRVDLDLAGREFALSLQDVDVSQSSQVLTAYLMTPWEDISLAAGSEVKVTVSADDVSYGTSFSLTEAKTLKAGHVSGINVTAPLEEQLFAGGDGTEENPWLIANVRHLGNMNAIYNDAADDAEFKYWFRMIDDVDASSISNWAPLNYKGSTWLKAIDFDGNGHTISNLKSSGFTYGSFAGVLFGDVHDVTFSQASIVNGASWCGVVAAFLGSGANYSRPASCTNVTVTGSSVTGAKNAGGFAGHVNTTGNVTNCSVINTTVSGPNYVGGFAAQADVSGVDKYEVPVIFTDCTVEGSTVTNTKTAAGAYFTGGFVGYTYQAVSFIGCQVKGTSVKANSAAIQNVGGFVGGTDYAGANFRECSVDSGTTVLAAGNHAGGFVGYANVPDAYKDCSSAASVTNTGEYTGAFAGYASGASTFTGCTACGNVSGYLHVGGFTGYAENASFTDCYYEDGAITASGTTKYTHTGGFCGYATTGVSFNGCYVEDASITTTGQRIGGFVGQLGASYTSSNNIMLTQCHVKNTAVTGSTNTGGFVGVQYDNISRCFVSGGSVTAKGAHCGGFSGFSQFGSLSHCYTTASVAGGSYNQVGGCIGILYDSSVSYCYSAGSISGGGTDMGAFVGQCALQGTPGTVTNCIGWHASLSFFGSNPAEASIVDCYAGNSGSVTAQAVSQGWPTGIWDLSSGNLPLLLSVPSRIPAIFVGDSITWQWARNSGTYDQSKYPLKIPFNSAYMTQSGNNVTVLFHPGFFSGHGYIDKGISGQNTTQMLSRFDKDVIALDPQVVVIMGGTNDLAQGVSKPDIVANIASMAQKASSAGIKVVLCSVTPNDDYYSKLNPHYKGSHIVELNEMIQSLVSSNGYTYCDYWTSMVTDPVNDLSLKEEFRLYDNLHPGPDGYDVMEAIIQPIIDNLLN